MTLAEILIALNDLDNAPTVEFDPHEIKEALHDKIDAVRAVVGRLKNESARLSEDAEMLEKASRAVERNADRLKQMVLWNMDQQGFEKLPGHLFRAQIITGAPSVKIVEEASAELALAFPEFIERKVTFQWSKAKIKEALTAGVDFAYGHLVANRYVNFFANKGTK